MFEATRGRSAVNQQSLADSPGLDSPWSPYLRFEKLSQGTWQSATFVASLQSMNRPLIRPNLSEIASKLGPRARKKVPPPTETHAEASYYVRQMTAKTPMVVILTDGEELNGIIEWYDEACIKLNRDNAPNLVLRKQAIKYLYKAKKRQNRRS